MTEDFIIENDVLYIDTRETSVLFKIIPFMNAKGISIKTIPITESLDMSGDYYYKCDKGELLIERKQMADLDGSIDDESVFYQSQKMALWLQAGNKRYAFIKTIGNNDTMNHHANINFAQRIGATESVTSRTGIPLQNYSHERGFIWSIYKNIRSLREGKMGQFRTLDLFKYVFPDIDLKLEDQKTIHINVLRCYGASKKQAIEIVNEFDIESYESLGLLSKIKDLKGIKGVGSKTSEKIFKRMRISGSNNK
ncbi:MAG: hypothetical protein V3V19_11145 [Cocleimonas sp.]